MINQKVKIAVVSTIYNESVLLPQFLRHYSPQVDAIFLIDNQSTDGSLDVVNGHKNVEISTLDTGGQFRTQDLCQERIAKAKSCSGHFDYVIIADCDEFLIPKEGGTIRSALERLWPVELLATKGYEVWRHPDEPLYDPILPLLKQRRWGIENDLYSKPIVFRPEIEIEFEMGFHELIDIYRGEWARSHHSEFFLLHIIGIEEEEYVRRSMFRTSRLSDKNIAKGWGRQYFGGTPDLFREKFRQAQEVLKPLPVDHG